MAGPSVMVKVLGDVSGLGKSFDQTATQGANAAGKMRTAFSGVLGQLNQSGVLGPFGAALGGADAAISQMTGHAKEIGPVMMGIGGAAAGLGLALSAMGSKDAQSHAQLQAAVTATGKSYDAYAGRVEAAIKTQEHFGHTADQTQDALRILTQATGDPDKALKLLNTTTDLAAAKHEDLATAAGQLGKAYNGGAKLMKEFGIVVSSTGTAQKELTTATKEHDKAVTASATSTRALAELQAADATGKALTTVQTMKLQDAQAKVYAANLKVVTSSAAMKKAQDDVRTGTSANSKAIDELGTKLKGQASAAADTFSGHLRALKAEVTDHIAKFGQQYGPAITAAGAAMTGLGATVQITSAAVTFLKESQMVQAVASGVATAAQWALNAAMNANPIMLIVLLLAALVAAVILAYQHVGWFRNAVDDFGRVASAAFHGFIAVVQEVFGWIENNWPLLVAILTGPIGLAIYTITSNWNTLVSFLKGIPAAIGSALSGMWDFISGEFKGVINAVIHAWNSLKFTTPSVDVFGFHTPSVTIGVPQIPYLQQGGLITQTGLVYAHAGEAITPAPDVGRRGPAVHVEHAHFGNELDVEAFMRRAAWVARTAAL